jgi:hypothetical protein
MILNPETIDLLSASDRWLQRLLPGNLDSKGGKLHARRANRFFLSNFETGETMALASLASQKALQVTNLAAGKIQVCTALSNLSRLATVLWRFSGSLE